VGSPFVSRLGRFGTIDSTQGVVRDWLETGVPEVCIAVADEQTAGRGRLGRSWTAPPGSGLLASAGFRPEWLPPRHVWRLASIVTLAMAEAAEEVASLARGTLGLKWPNDLVADRADGGLRKLAGVLGETVMDTGRVVNAIVGIGINVDWREADFPPDLAGSMTSLRALANDLPIDRERLLDAWLARLEPGYQQLRAGQFDADAWAARQRTTGREVEVDLGNRVLQGTADGVDPDSGALLVRVDATGAVAAIDHGGIVRCRLIDPPPGAL
jgi:BirA family biotin operon repressor/biotin-[acetyl-CoA-carboxylase] ligase